MKQILGEFIFGKYRPDSGKIQFPVIPEPEKGFEFPVPD